jgi:hypothetical protein
MMVWGLPSGLSECDLRFNYFNFEIKCVNLLV